MSKTTRAPWTLRRRLTVTMAGLLVVAAALIGVVSVVSLRSFLTERLDQQLTSAVIRSTAAVDSGIINGRPGHMDGDDDHDDRPNDALLAPGQAAGTLVAVVDMNNNVTAGVLNQRGQVVAVNLRDVSALAAITNDAKPSTIHVQGAGEYRAVSVTTTGGSLVIALPMTEVNAATTQLLLVILSVTGIGLAAAIIAGRMLIRYELTPLDRVADTATRVSELPLDKGDVELAEFAVMQN